MGKGFPAGRKKKVPFLTVIVIHSILISCLSSGIAYPRPIYGDHKGELPRGWNWVDVIKHLAKTGTNEDE